MRIRDARSLPPEAQEDIRRKAVLDGRKQVDVAQIFGITRQAVGNWVKAHRSYGLRFEKGGVKVLKAKPKGRHLEEDRFFPGRQLVGREPRAPDLSWCQVCGAPDLPAGLAGLTGHAGLADGCFSFFSVVLRYELCSSYQRT